MNGAHTTQARKAGNFAGLPSKGATMAHFDSTLSAFRELAAALSPAAEWQWIGPHMSQRMFGITRERAEAYAKRHGGTAQPMKAAE